LDAKDQFYGVGNWHRDWGGCQLADLCGIFTLGIVSLEKRMVGRLDAAQPSFES
jgi:hypothetical protein